MKNSMNIPIGLLCVTAALLLTAILFVDDGNVAEAGTAQSRAGDYIMVSGEVSKSTEFVYLFDVQAQQMRAYRVDRQRLTIVPIDNTQKSLSDLVTKYKAATAPERDTCR